jgi:putative membrane protein
MKRILRHFVIDTFCLYLITKIASGVQFGNGFYTLIAAGAAITVVSLIAKPVINILLLPINLITFGLFRWVASSIVLYLTSLIVPTFKILYFNFPGIASRWIDIPKLEFNGLLAYIGFSFILSLISSLIYWLIK